MKSTRRTFLKNAAASAGVLAFPTILPRHVYGGPGHVPPSEKVLLGMVGVGGQGRHNTEQFLALEDVQIKAIADPAEFWDLHEFYYDNVAGRKPVKALLEAHYKETGRPSEVAEYLDFREMLANEPDLDGIVCSTPDHTHAFVVATALKAGKHVYCEKPLTHNLWELREIRRLARETGLATQMGNYGHSSDGIRRTVEIVRSGLLGEIREASAWGFGARWNPGFAGLPKVASPLPDGLDWDLWLGPRAPVPFHEAYAPVKWRDFWMFGTGALGDFGCHDLDAIVWAFDLAHPESIEVVPGGFALGEWNADVIPYSEIGYYRFGAGEKQKPVDVTWYSGSLKPPQPEILEGRFELPPRGVMFHGERGVLQADGAGGSPRVFPAKLRAEAKKVPESIARSKGHFRDWIDAIKNGTQSSANFEYSARLTEIVLLGVLSLRLSGRRIDWDAENLKVPGVAEADAFIREKTRPGWEIG